MAKEQKEQKPKLSYEELEQVAAQLQQQAAEAQAQLRNVNEIREMAYMCIELLKYKDVLPPVTFNKVVDFIDKLVPVPKEKTENAE